MKAVEPAILTSELLMSLPKQADPMQPGGDMRPIRLTVVASFLILALTPALNSLAQAPSNEPAMGVYVRGEAVGAVPAPRPWKSLRETSGQNSTPIAPSAPSAVTVNAR